MMRRWVIRSIIIALILVCLGGWGWSVPHFGWVSYCGVGRWVQGGTDGGVVMVGSGRDTGWRGRGFSAITGINPIRFWPLGHPSIPALLGFDLQRAGDGVFLVVPYWFFIVVFSFALFIVWRKRRKKGVGGAFPVEMAKKAPSPAKL